MKILIGIIMLIFVMGCKSNESNESITTADPANSEPPLSAETKPEPETEPLSAVEPANSEERSEDVEQVAEAEPVNAPEVIPAAIAAPAQDPVPSQDALPSQDGAPTQDSTPEQAPLVDSLPASTATELNYKVEVQWDQPTTRQNGSLLSGSEITAYRIHYGLDSGNLGNSVEVADAVNLSHVIELPSTGLWYISMTAVDNQGLESDYSGLQQIYICDNGVCDGG